MTSLLFSFVGVVVAVLFLSLFFVVVVFAVIVIFVARINFCFGRGWVAGAFWQPEHCYTKVSIQARMPVGQPVLVTTGGVDVKIIMIIL